MPYWKHIPGFEQYLVSTEGEVVSTLYGKFKTLKCGYHKFGYPQVGLAGRFQRAVHHLVLIAFRGPKKEGQVCRHLDGNPKNCRVENLQWGTPKENAQDKLNHGTAKYVAHSGESNGFSKFNAETILEIRNSPLPTKEVSEKYNVSTSYVHKIRKRTVWRHLNG